MKKLRVLLGTTCFSALAVATVPAFAQTAVTSDSSTPLVTSSAGDVTIQHDAELTVESGAAITVNSNNTVTIEEDDDDDDDEDTPGQITMGGSDGATGILIQPGVTTTVSNAGAITVLEDYDPLDEDENGIADGAIANASDRYGIYVAPGGTVTGTITNTGSIYVEGKDSGGIVLDSTLDGSLVQQGTIYVAGENSVGIRTADVTGDVIVEGTTVVTGAGATALSIEGDVGGTVRIQGAVGQQPSFTYNEDGNTVSMSRFDLRQGTPAALIAGNVAGGIVIAAPPANNDSDDDDEDNDGVDDSDEGTGSIVSYGNGPALQIGGANDITIGALPSANGSYSLLVEGTIGGTATYSRTDAQGLVIGGAGGTVDLPGGIGVTGAIGATTQDSVATALLINQGATVGSLYVSGSISAQINSPGEGEAYAIRDLSGTLTTIENTGFISASGSNTDIVRAIDLSAATSDVTISQHLNAEDAETRAEIEEDLDEGETDTTVYTGITGHIETGSGNDTIDAASGTIIGNIYFNAGDDRLLLSGDAYYRGKAYFGDGIGTVDMSGDSSFVGTLDFAGNAGTLTISGDAAFAGSITNGAAASVIVAGGEFGTDGIETSSVGSLTVKDGGALRVHIDGDTQESSLITVGDATFESGSRVVASVSSIIGADGSYVVLTADQITGIPTLDDSSLTLPFIFKGSLSVENNELIVDIARKQATELGLRGASATGYDTILTASLANAVVEQSFLDILDEDTLQAQISQMLPDHSGGLFDWSTQGTRLVSQHIMDRDATFEITEPGTLTMWLEPVTWHGNRRATESSAYKTNGFGMSGGAEWLTDFGYFGGSFAWLNGKVTNNGGSDIIKTSQLDVGAFWRTGRSGPLYAYARIGGARTSYSGARTVELTANDADYSYTSSADWNGWLYSGMGGVTYDFLPTSKLKLRPKLGLEWFQLREDGYQESGGGDAIDLTVADRKSNVFNAISTLTFSYSFGGRSKDSTPLTIELEGGRRSVLSGKLGSTTANFVNDDVVGDTFTITPGSPDDAWIGEVRLLGGDFDYTWKLAAGAEKAANGDPAVSARASFSIAF